MADFNISIKTVLENEGGLCNVSGDPGGLTNFGISQRAYPDVDIRNLTAAGAAAIYRRDFWHYDAVESQLLATKIFDMSVNMGHTAISILQRCVSVMPDGIWGPNTCAATNTINATMPGLLDEYKMELANHYRNIVAANPTQAQFLTGWLRRAAQ
jgi:lysozyme family protein